MGSMLGRWDDFDACVSGVGGESGADQEGEGEWNKVKGKKMEE